MQQLFWEPKHGMHLAIQAWLDTKKWKQTGPSLSEGEKNRTNKQIKQRLTLAKSDVDLCQDRPDPASGRDKTEGTSEVEGGGEEQKALATRETHVQETHVRVRGFLWDLTRLEEY